MALRERLQRVMAATKAAQVHVIVGGCLQHFLSMLQEEVHGVRTVTFYNWLVHQHTLGTGMEGSISCPNKK